MSAATPMMRQYLEIKSRYPDAILFFRLGDFYEMFMDDAVTAAKVLDITLTSRNKGSADEIPLCGVPHHSCQPYIAKLVEHGHKVAICEQVEDPRQAKGIVQRDVVRVVTPGLVIDPETLQPKENNFLMALACGNGRHGVALVDITTGEFRVTETPGSEDVRTEIASAQPKEVLIPDSEAGALLVDTLGYSLAGRSVNRLPEHVFELDRARGEITSFFGVANLDPFGCSALPAAIAAAGAALHYLRETQMGATEQIRSLTTYSSSEHLALDEATRRNLELNANLQDGKRKGSLLGVLDRTVTAMGGRLLRRWLNYPLVDVAAIQDRHAAVEELLADSFLRADLREALDGVYDLERLVTRAIMGTANARDLVTLRLSLERLPAIIDRMAALQAPLLAAMHDRLDPVDDVAALVDAALVDDPPVALRDGGLIRDGFHAELDELRTISREGKGWIARLEGDERQRTGIASLKVRYNKVFGYYIEVTRTHLDKVPEDYERKQTLANAERYITPTLKEYEAKVLGAEERLVSLEYEVFVGVRQQVAACGARIQETARQLARLDVLQGLAELAHDRRYVRPEIAADELLSIEEGRHPVIESMNLGERFVPNDVLLDNRENQLLIITGPNMAGKSTFMRQVALITLMAQMGSFVPAKRARIGVVDRIFTRVGASDNLARGLSTFMVEMNETANILHHATPRSLVILDEIGRGTSTFDGVSIAWAVAEYLHDHAPVAAKTLFATHYHELAELGMTRERIKNFNVAVREWNDQVVFLRRIVPGPASHSYGIQVARLAGLPGPVIERAKEVLRNLEAGELDADGSPRLARDGEGAPHPPASPQLTLFAGENDLIRERLALVDIASLTPLEALNLLNELKELV